MVVTRFHHSWSWSITRVQFHTGDGRSDRGSKWYKLSIGWHRLGYGGSCLFSFKNMQKQGSSMHERRERVWSSAQRRHLEPGRGETARYHRMGKYKGFACMYLLIFFVWEWLLLNFRCFPGKRWCWSSVRSTSLQNMRQAATSLPDSDTGFVDRILCLIWSNSIRVYKMCFSSSHAYAVSMCHTPMQLSCRQLKHTNCHSWVMGQSGLIVEQVSSHRNALQFLHVFTSQPPPARLSKRHTKKESEALSETDCLCSSKHGLRGIGFGWFPVSHEGLVSRFKVQGDSLLLCSSTNFVGYSHIPANLPTDNTSFPLPK